MNTTILHRLAWKEFRTLRPLWLSLLAVAAVLQVGLVWLFDRQHWFNNGVPFYPRAAWLVGVLAALPAMFAAVSLAMSFAGERDDGTDQFLCRLAPPPLKLLGVKVGLCVAGAFAMFVLLVPLTIVIDLLAVPRDLYTLQVDPLDQKTRWESATRLAKFHPELTVIFQSIRDTERESFIRTSWVLNGLLCGIFFSLLFRGVLSCLIGTTVTLWVFPQVTSALLPATAGPGWVDSVIHFGVMPGTLLLASVWLAQTWDESRWPRAVEFLIGRWQALNRLRLRTDSTVERSNEATRRVSWVLRLAGFGDSDEWLPAWRREVRRLLWLEWQSAWWVFWGLVVAASVALLSLLGTAKSQADMRFVMTILPLTLAFVAFAMGVWSFQGQQREQRFRFFAAQGASPNAMWLVKHVVWLGFAVVAVLFLLGFAVLTSEQVIGRDEFSHAGLLNSIDVAMYNANWHGTTLEYPYLTVRLVFLAARVTGTTPTEIFESDEVVGIWPLVSLLLLSLSRGAVGVWLCFAIGQLAALVIPRAVTALLIGVFPLGLAVGWWIAMSFLQVPLLIAICPVLLGVLAAAWGGMSDWLEDRSGWRHWVRVAATVLAPMLVAFVGMAVYRVYEIPKVELPFQRGVPSAEARQTGEAWMRLAEQLESSIARPTGTSNDDNGVHSEEWREQRISSAASAHWEGFGEREWLAANAPTLEEALRLAQRPDCALPKSWEPNYERQRDPFGGLVLLLKMSAFESLENHRLDEALQRALALYRFGQQLATHRGTFPRWQQSVEVQEAAMHVLREWAMSSDQTEESLLTALGRTEQGPPHPIAQLVRAEGSFTVDPLELLRSDYSETLDQFDERWQQVIPSALRWMVSEQAREVRLLNVLAQEGINNVNHAMTRRAWQPEHQRLSAPYGRLLEDQRAILDRYTASRLSRGGHWQQTTQEVELGWGWNEQQLAMQYFPVLGSLETHRRGLWLTIALQAYRVKHGRLPDRLDDLVGRYLDRLPSDPFNGTAFDYRPHGYPFVVNDSHRQLTENTPILSASGEYAVHREPVATNYWNQVRGREHSDEVDVVLSNDTAWVSVFANRVAYGEIVSSPHFHRAATFSLKPSF